MRILLLLFAISSLSSIFPPTDITLRNASFEGTPQDAKIPDEWFPCGKFSTPDILPGPWGVYQEAADGNTFLGLISREDGTWEFIGQDLDKPLKKNECYTFRVKLARSTGYVGYNKPLKFRIWGGTQRCEKLQLLGHTVAVLHNNWKSYRFDFFADNEYSFIVIEAHYSGKEPYRGNLLIDDCSPFETCVRASLD